MSHDVIDNARPETDILQVELGNAADLTLGGAAGSSEDKRFVYS